MASFVLQKCKLRDGWLVPVKNTEPLTLDWGELCALLAPSKSQRALLTLRHIQVSGYVGLVRQPTFVSNFVVRNADLSGDIRQTIKRDPTFAQRLVDAYRVDSVVWDDKLVEPQKVP
jgi:hypothetical protein